eukprot:3830891-Amphidinium_carterae.1
MQHNVMNGAAKPHCCHSRMFVGGYGCTGHATCRTNHTNPAKAQVMHNAIYSLKAAPRRLLCTDRTMTTHS